MVKYRLQSICRVALIAGLVVFPNFWVYSQTFTEVVTGFENKSSSYISWGDINNDGYLDAIVIGAGTSTVPKLYLNNGDKTFTDISAGLNNSTAFSGGQVKWGDYNSDGYLDLLLTGNNVPVVLRNRGNNTFEATDTAGIILGTDALQNASCDWLDYDLDGDLDIIVQGKTASLFCVLYKNIDGQFSSANKITLTGGDYGNISWADLNDDGYPDMLINGSNTAPAVWLYLNDQTGGFTMDSRHFDQKGYKAHYAFADIDADGDFDIIASGNSQQVRSMKNADGVFFDTVLHGISLSQSFQASGDISTDGLVDIIAGGVSGLSAVRLAYFKYADTTFVLDSRLDSLKLNCINFVDIDNDNDLDISFTGLLGTTTKITKVYENAPGTVNLAPSVPSNLGVSVSGAQATLSWSKATDDKTPQEGLTYNVHVYELGGDTVVHSMSILSSGQRKLVRRGNASENNFFIIKNLTADKKYVWTVQAIDNSYVGGGFAVSDTFALTESVPAKPGTPTGDASGCYKIEESRWYHTTGATTAISYVWQITPAQAGVVVSYGDSAFVTWSNNYSGSAQLTVIGINQIGTGAASDPLTYVFNELPQGSLSDTTIQCGTSNSVLDPGLFSLYSWSLPGGGSSTQPTITATSTDLGKYFVTITDNNGCVGNDSTFLQHSDLPVIELGSPVSSCDASVTLDAGSGFSSYNWTGGGTNQTLIVTSTNNYFVTVTNNKGCSATDNVSVSINGQPAVDLGIDKEACKGETVALDPGNYTTYEWNTGETSRSIIVSTTGTYIVTITDANNCSNSDTVEVNIHDLPVINIGADIDACVGDTKTLDAGAGFTYSWNDASTAQTLDVNTTGIYHVTVTDANSCTDRDTITVTYHALPVVDLGADKEACQGEIVTLDAGIGFTYNWNDASSLQTLSVDATGTYHVTITDGYGCKDKDTVGVTIHSLPIVNLGTDKEACQGQTVTLDAGAGYTYLWDDNSTSQTLDVTASGTYMVTITDGNTCENSDTIVVTIHDLPIINLGIDKEACNGQTVTLDAGAGFSYLWSDNSSAQTLEVVSTGTYNVTITDGNSCENSDTIDVLFHSNPVVDLGIDKEACDGDVVSLDAGSGFTYNWNDNSTAQTIDVTSSGTYHVTITDGNSCIDRDTIAVTVHNLPIVSLGADKDACLGDVVTLDAGAGFTYIWSDNSTNRTLAINTSGTFNVTVTDANNCVNADTVTVTIHTLPVVNLGADTEVCNGLKVQFDAGNFESYLWSGGQTTKLIEAGAAGEYSVEVTDINGCKNSDTVLLAVLDLPVVSLGEDINLCEGTNKDITAGNNYVSYLWNTGATTESININSGGEFSLEVTGVNGCKNKDTIVVSVVNNPIFSLGADKSICDGKATSLNGPSGLYTYLWNTNESTQNIVVDKGGNYILTITDLNGCIAKDTLVLNIIAKPAISLGSDLSKCEGESVALMPGDGYASYLWNTGATSSSIVVDKSGTYSVAVTNTQGCVAKDTMILTINALPGIELGNDINACENDEVVIYANSGLSEYLWNDGSILDSLVVKIEGQYYVTVTDNNNCKNSDTVMVIFHAYPIVNLGKDTTICDGTNITLSAPAGNTYLWSNNKTDQNITVSTEGEISVKVTSMYGCISNDTIVIGINPIPVVNLGNDREACKGQEVTLVAGDGSDVYKWNNGSENATLIVTESGTYSVMVTNMFNCSSSDIINVTIHELPLVNLGSDTSICGLTYEIAVPFSYSEYLWNTSATDSMIVVNLSGEYSVTVTDKNQCKNSDTIVIELKPVPFIDLGKDIVACENEQVILDAGAFNAYLWSTSETTQTIIATTSDSYFVEVKNEFDCINSDTIEVIINKVPKADFSYNTDKGKATFNNLSKDANSYSWNFGDGSGESTEQSPVYTYVANGDYNVRLTASNLECGDSVIVKMVNITGVGIIDLTYGSIELYPNPAKDYVSIDYFTGNYQTGTNTNVELLSSEGRIILTQELFEGNQIIDVSGQDEGVYLLKVIQGNKQWIGKLIIKR